MNKENKCINESFFNENFPNFDFVFENHNTVVCHTKNFLDIMPVLQANDKLKFEILIDIVAIDYSDYGISEWNSKNANNKGYSRGIKKIVAEDTHTLLLKSITTNQKEDLP